MWISNSIVGIFYLYVHKQSTYMMMCNNWFKVLEIDGKKNAWNRNIDDCRKEGERLAIIQLTKFGYSQILVLEDFYYLFFTRKYEIVNS